MPKNPEDKYLWGWRMSYGDISRKRRLNSGIRGRWYATYRSVRFMRRFGILVYDNEHILQRFVQVLQKLEDIDLNDFDKKEKE